MVELFLWDMFLMPLSLAVLTKSCQKRRGIVLHFKGLLV